MNGTTWLGQWTKTKLQMKLSLPTTVPAPHPFGTSLIRPVPLPPKAGHAHIVLTPGNLVPMDLDAAKKRVMELLCYRCNLPSHFGKNCPTWFDVRMMFMDKLQDVLENRMALLDAAPLDTPQLPEISPEIAVISLETAVWCSALHTTNNMETGLGVAKL